MELSLEDVVEFYLKHNKKKRKTKTKKEKSRRNGCSNEEEEEESVPSTKKKTKLAQNIENQGSSSFDKEACIVVGNQTDDNVGPKPQEPPSQSWIIKNFHHGTAQVSSSHHLRRYDKRSYDMDLQIAYSWKYCQTDTPFLQQSHTSPKSVQTERSLVQNCSPVSIASSRTEIIPSGSKSCPEKNRNVHFGNETLSNESMLRPSLLSSEFESTFVNGASNWSPAVASLSSKGFPSVPNSNLERNGNFHFRNESQQKELTFSVKEEAPSSTVSSYPLSNHHRCVSLTVDQNIKVEEAGLDSNIVEFATSEFRRSLNKEIWIKSDESSSSSDSDSSGSPFNSKFLKKQPAKNSGHGATSKSVARILSKDGPVRVLPTTSSDDSSGDENQSSPAPRKPLKVQQKESLIGRSPKTKTATGTGKKSKYSSVDSTEEIVIKPLTNSKPLMFDDWVSIKEAFRDIYSVLGGDDHDRAVKYILDQNIPIRFMNVIIFTKQKTSDVLSKTCPNLKLKKLSSGDDENIMKRWRQLVRDVPIHQPKKCFEVLKATSKDPIKMRKRNIVGCFLGKDLLHIRLAIDIFQRCKILLDNESQDKIVPVQPNLPNRVSEGFFLPHEDEEILAYFFSSWNGQEETEYIRSITENDLQVIAQRLNRSTRAVQEHWNNMIRPTLLAYYNKTHLVSIRKSLCEYFISRKVESLRNFSWDDVLKMFPCETVGSLCSEIYRVLRYFEKTFPGFEHLPLHEKISRTESYWKMYKFNERVISNRKRIIQTYLLVFGRGAS